MANCVRCRQDIEPGTRCDRCGTQDKGRLGLTLGYFAGIWGVMSFVFILPPLFMLLPGVYRLVDAALQPIASLRIGGPIALLNAFIIAFFMFSLREALHLYTLQRQYRPKPGPSLAVLALAFFLVAILLGFLLGFGVTSKDSVIGPPGYPSSALAGMVAHGSFAHLLIKLVMTGVLIFIFISFSLFAGMMAVYEYSRYLDEHRYDPIFLDQQLLLKVVLNDVRRHLHTDEAESADAKAADANQGTDGAEKRIVISEMKRLGDGGIGLTVHDEGRLVERDKVVLKEDRTWYVESDCWGYLKKVEEKSRRVARVQLVSAGQ